MSKPPPSKLTPKQRAAIRQLERDAEALHRRIQRHVVEVLARRAVEEMGGRDA